MKKLFLILSFIISTSSRAQIHIDQAGDDWRSFIDSSLRIVKSKDPEKYALIDSVCKSITMWNGDFSSCEGGVGSLFHEKRSFSGRESRGDFVL